MSSVDSIPCEPAAWSASARSAGREPVVAEHDRLEREREVAQLADRRALLGERRLEDLARLVEPPARRASAARRRASARSRRAAAPARRGGRARAAAARPARPRSAGRAPRGRFPSRGRAQSIIASRSAIATACVRVSASSFVRMWRTWLLTVSWEMKSRSATSPFESPSASSWRISRSRGGEHVALVPAGEELRHQRRVDVALAGGDLLDRAHERAVRRLLEDVALRARLERRARAASAPSTR